MFHLVMKQCVSCLIYYLTVYLDILSQQRMKPDKPPNPSITFIPQTISNGPFSALLAVKPAWTSGEIERYVNNKSCEKKYLCSRCDGTLALKSNNTDDKGLPLNPHPDIFFLEIDA